MNLKIIISFLVGLIVLQLIGAGVFFYLTARKNSVPAQSIQQTSQTSSSTTSPHGKIMLVADHPTVKVGETVAISVTIDTDQKPVDGVDLSLQFDPHFFEPVLVSQKAFVPGRLFPDVPLNAYDLRAGTASMSAISTLDKNFVGTGTFGVITFKALKPGTTTVRVAFQPGNTTDSNMVVEGKEILSEIKDATVTIK